MHDHSVYSSVQEQELCGVANCGRFRTCNSYCKCVRMIINLQDNVLLWHHHNYSLSNYHQTSIMMLTMKASCLLYNMHTSSYNIVVQEL